MMTGKLGTPAPLRQVKTETARARLGDQARLRNCCRSGWKLARRRLKLPKILPIWLRRSRAVSADTHGAMSSIHEGIRQVEGGVQLACEAGESLEQIVSGSVMAKQCNRA